MLILHILQIKGDCYGYEICQLIKLSSDNFLSFPEGSIYPSLYKMIDNGYVSDYKKQTGKRMTRVYYHIEEKGKEHLADIKQEYYKTNESIQKVLNFNFNQSGHEKK